MKTTVYALLFSVVFALTSCELETSSHGDLYAFWHLERIDSLDGGGQLDLEKDLLFWSFQAKLLELDDKNGVYPNVLMRFEKSGNTLRVFDPYFYNREEGDEPINDIAPLTPFGINELEDVFTIEKLKRGKLVLCSQKVRLHLKKF